MASIHIIGSGFSSLACSAVLASKGHDVTIIEKLDHAGGRARQWKHDGFTFDMGPSWYWMPEVFEHFYQRFGKTASDFYELQRLDPSYQIIYEDGEILPIPAELDELYQLFDSKEPGSSLHLKEFLQTAKYKYDKGMNEFVWKPGHSVTEFADFEVLKSLFQLQMLRSISTEIRSKFKNPKLIQLLEFPVLFLGAAPSKTPALYSLMNYADLSLGTWYPKGGMHEIVAAMKSIAVDQGVHFNFEEAVLGFKYSDNAITTIITQNDEYQTDFVVSGADYHHTDTELLPEEYRSYTDRYWETRKMAPSSLLYYVGIDKVISGLLHHNLFFDRDFNQHVQDIYSAPAWPKEPLFYACCPSVTDPSVAPSGSSNLFLLVPLAPGLEDSQDMRDSYLSRLLSRIEHHFGEDLQDHVLFSRSYCMTDFIDDYNAYKGNAYGLANTLFQTAFLKPKISSKKIKNLYFTGQLTTPGPGVPPSIISGQVVAKELLRAL